MNGYGIAYAEIDDGRWCEREHGHTGLHVLDETEGPLLEPQGEEQ